jgi:hypothetical protein
MSTAPTYMAVDPAALVVPTDNAQVPAYLTEIKNVLIAINHNLSTYIQTNGADLATINTTLGNHDQSLTNLDGLMVQALAGITGTGTRGGNTRAPKLASPSKFDGSDKNKAVSFRVAVAHYLQTSYPQASVNEQIAFIISCLDGKAHEWLEPYLEQDVVQNVSVP